MYLIWNNKILFESSNSKHWHDEEKSKIYHVISTRSRHLFEKDTPIADINALNLFECFGLFYYDSMHRANPAERDDIWIWGGWLVEASPFGIKSIP